MKTKSSPCPLRPQEVVWQETLGFRGSKNTTSILDGWLVTFFLVTFYSPFLEKGVYYNPYFTIDNPDTDGQLIFPIIILPQYNIAQSKIIPQKGTIIIPFRSPNGFFKRIKGLVFNRNIESA